MSLEIAQDQRGDVRILSLTGRLDLDSAATLQLALEDAIAAGGHHIVLDMTGLGYLSNAGLEVIVAMNDRLRKLGSLRLCGLSPALREVVGAVGQQKKLALYADIDAALAGHPSAKLDPDLVSSAATLIGANPPGKAVKGDPAIAEAAAELLGANDNKPTPTKKIPIPEPVPEPTQKKRGMLDKLKGLLSGED